MQSGSFFEVFSYFSYIFLLCDKIFQSNFYISNSLKGYFGKQIMRSFEPFSESKKYIMKGTNKNHPQKEIFQIRLEIHVRDEKTEKIYLKI